MKEIILVRHPRAAVAHGVCYGRTDLALAEPSQAFAQALRDVLPASVRIVSSPARRCAEVARALGPHQIDERLTEIDFGEWEMRRFDDIGAEALNLWAADTLGFRPPGGETVAEMAARVNAALREHLRIARGHLCFITHGGPLRAITGSLLGLPAEDWTRLVFRVGAISRLRPDIAGWCFVERDVRPTGRDVIALTRDRRAVWRNEALELDGAA